MYHTNKVLRDDFIIFFWFSHLYTICLQFFFFTYIYLQFYVLLSALRLLLWLREDWCELLVLLLVLLLDFWGPLWLSWIFCEWLTAVVWWLVCTECVWCACERFFCLFFFLLPLCCAVLFTVVAGTLFVVGLFGCAFCFVVWLLLLLVFCSLLAISCSNLSSICNELDELSLLNPSSGACSCSSSLIDESSSSLLALAANSSSFSAFG